MVSPGKWSELYHSIIPVFIKCGIAWWTIYHVLVTVFVLMILFYIFYQILSFMIISYVVNPHDHAHYWGDAIRPMAITGETHGGRLGCLGCWGSEVHGQVWKRWTRKVTCFCYFLLPCFSLFFHVFPTIPMCNKVMSFPFQSSCLWYPFVALEKNEAWDTWRPHIKAWCITWYFCVGFFLLGRCWKIQ